MIIGHQRQTEELQGVRGNEKNVGGSKDVMAGNWE